MPNGLFTLKQQVLAIREGGWPGQPPTSVNYLVVAGGGAGSYNRGGAGGGGGLLQGNIPITPGTSYTVTVGAGGAARSTNGQGNSGNNSIFGSITATGGGGGGDNTGSIGSAGGSGGGSGNSGTDYGGQAVFGQGNIGGGGTYAGPEYGGGGGGGAGTRGGTGTGNFGGFGGAGAASDISGTRTTYAGGGGGSSYSTASAAGVGGAGGGGSGGSSGGVSGAVNSGGGGGGTNNGTSGAGGSGIVIVSYPGSTQWFTGGVVNYYNGTVIHMFYQSGTLAPTAPTSLLPSYQISRSLRFNSADSSYLDRTPASAGNRKTWTFSTWVKRSGLGAGNANYMFFTPNGNSDPTWSGLIFYSSDVLVLEAWTFNYFMSSGVYRDPSAWYHLVVSWDSTQATASERVKVYVNGQSAPGSYNYPLQNADSPLNAAVLHRIGVGNRYMTEINFIDGQALTPSSFGETNAQTGVWQPKAYTGTYGTNGFYLNFSDNSNTTAATLGKDYSGNGNNWTPNNFSVSAGAGNDSLVDTPTPYGLADTGVGGEVRGNYCTLNPINAGSTATLTNGNLDFAGTSTASTSLAYATIGVSSGKWYWEVTAVTGTHMIGIGKDGGRFDWQTTNGYGYFGNSGNKYTNNAATSYGATYTNGDVIGVALDMDVGTLTFYKNGVSQGAAFSGLSGTYFPAAQNPGAVQTESFNFGQRPFAYTAPAGFRALTTWNLPTPTVGSTSTTQAGKYFDTTLWTGNDGAQTITNSGFQPDLIWVKCRNTGAIDHGWTDVLRGPTSFLSSSLSQGEQTIPSSWVNPATTGIALNTSNGTYNGSGKTYVGWQWKANGSGSSNTAGSITSTVSANTTSGFSIVTWTGTGSAGSVGHGLGVAPNLIIIKGRNISGATSSWWTWCSVLSSPNANWWRNYLTLNTTSAVQDWGDNSGLSSAPSSTVLNIGNYSGINGSSNTFVAYCFAEVPGYSRFGSYTGNASTDGPFVYCGFRPKFVLLKTSSASGLNWVIIDATRDPTNVATKLLYPNLSNAEGSENILDITSNGFKLRTVNQDVNGNSFTYIFAAFAEFPQKYSLAR